jgi:hypothetical protein
VSAMGVYCLGGALLLFYVSGNIRRRAARQLASG